MYLYLYECELNQKLRTKEKYFHSLCKCIFNINDAVCRWFALRLGHNKDNHKNGTNCLPGWHACVKAYVKRK